MYLPVVLVILGLCWLSGIVLFIVLSLVCDLLLLGVFVVSFALMIAFDGYAWGFCSCRIWCCSLIGFRC